MKPDAKKKIVDATIKLIQSKESRPEDITVRDICKEAGVGLSQINYHFQTKENLIAQCIQLLIGDVIGQFPKILSLMQGASAVDTLKRMMFSTMDFLYANENISRISILTDQHNAGSGDNTAQTIHVYLPLVEAALKENSIRDDPEKLTALIIFALQGMFLRTDVINSTLGVDLRMQTERAQFVGDFIDRVFA